MSHHKPDPNKSVNLTIDGIPVTVPEGTRILEAARKVNVHIPTLCDHPDLCKRAVCRLCVVECDGRGKLAAACANDVWEGVSIVTNNARIQSIRRTIVELLLANHPNECLTCIRSKNCELQTLAAAFGIREPAFRHSPADRRQPLPEAETLVRDMAKCIKCGRCVEACQEVQGIRAINSSRRGPRYEITVPYDQALVDSPCVFCGHCLAVCPVGAIYEYDHSPATWAAIRDQNCQTAVQIAPAMSEALNSALGLMPGTVKAGKTVTALKRLGFDKVYDAGVFARASEINRTKELLDRIENKDRLEKQNLPMIAVNSFGLVNFVQNAYPDLAGHLSITQSPRQLFAAAVSKGATSAQTACVSIVESVAEKYRPENPPQGNPAPDLALTVRELAQMVKLAGIDFKGLPETPFDTALEAPDAQTAAAVNGVQVLATDKLSEARAILDSIRSGTCDAALVEIKNFPATEM